ncbi:YkgJ family cysteine cluster protein [Pseudomonas aeruginosa]|nr:YkgJ family cysteine cluster protein [Pseudomonas aeruginosa]MBX5840100.1 YkgJ family cysteine cluster protein [Pseudomonas aeruginosa]MBX6064204.1 YkgJ family cysteine cluster protein [Pseudomonas aeruginosa]MBX6139403.1 YkgJ family cysteine cluster protein [Pseudomonas aeruginosa]MBX6159211.1 YkgJ family cysteine cluster protein [Pseudomonas aeruginosa]
MSTDNPCLTCGACCAHFRVSFYWGECRSAGGVVPDELTVRISPQMVAMSGTENKPARCVGLLGEIGCGVRCTVYEQRSSTCREFEAAWANGQPNPACDAARAAYGLPPLTPPLQPHLAPGRVA